MLVESQTLQVSPMSHMSRPTEPVQPVQPMDSGWPAPVPVEPSESQWALFPPSRVRVRRPRHASTQLVSSAAIPVLAGVGLSGWWVFVLVEALFPTAVDGSCPRLVMGVAGLVVLVCGAGLAAAATGTQVGGAGGRR